MEISDEPIPSGSAVDLRSSSGLKASQEGPGLGGSGLLLSSSPRKETLSSSLRKETLSSSSRTETVKQFYDSVPPQNDWFFGAMERYQTEEALGKTGVNCFLVRNSSMSGCYALSR